MADETAIRGLADGRNGRPANAETIPYGVYVAGGGGALLAAIGDYLRNVDASVAWKLSDMLFAQHFALAFFFVTAVGVFACWVVSTSSRTEALTRGFAALTLLTVASPFNGSSGGLNPRSEGIAPSPRSMLSAASLPDGTTVNWIDGTIVVRLVFEGTSPADPQTFVTVRSEAENSVLGRLRMSGIAFELTQPVGRYILDIEADGYQRVAAHVEIRPERTGYEIRLSTSNIPLSLQRFYAPAEVTPIPLDVPTT